MSTQVVGATRYIDADRVAAFNLAPTGSFRISAAPASVTNRDFATTEPVRLQAFGISSGAQAGAVAASGSQDGITIDGACEYITQAEGFVRDNRLIYQPTAFGAVVPGGTTTVTNTTTALSGPLASAANVDAATLAALGTLAGRRFGPRVSGVGGGGQVGYNHQIGTFVVGVEADLQGADVNGANRIGAFSQRASLDWYGTARARFGYALDRLLVYSTGGLAYGDVSLTYGLGNLSVGETRLQVGWTAGSGVEYALTPQVSVKAEYKHLELGASTYLRRAGYDARMRVAADTGVIGLNYRW